MKSFPFAKTILFAFIFGCIVCNLSLHHTYADPLPIVDTEAKEIYANGASLTLEDGESGNTKVRYDDIYLTFDGSIEADLSEYTLFGGGVYETLPSSSITINGGTLKEVYGSSKEHSVLSTHVIMNGGKVSNLYGGGYGQNASSDTTRVEINDGIITNNVYGGGRDGAVRKDTSVYIRGGRMDSVFGAGATLNGTTRNSFLYVTGGDITHRVRGGSFSFNASHPVRSGIVLLPGKAFASSFDHLLHKSDHDHWETKGRIEIPSFLNIHIRKDELLQLSDDSEIVNQGTLHLDGQISGTGKLSGEGKFIQTLREDLLGNIENQIYSGVPICPSPVILSSDILGQTFLVDNDSYRYSYANHTDSGIAKIIFQTENSEFEKTFSILPLPIQESKDFHLVIPRLGSFEPPNFQSPLGEPLTGEITYTYAGTAKTYPEILALWQASSASVETFSYTFTANGNYTGTIAGNLVLELAQETNPPAPRRIYRISLTGDADRASEESTDYFAVLPHSITIKNTGNRSTGILDLRLSGRENSAFELSVNQLNSIAPGQSATFFVSPKIGLPAGIYEEEYHISGSHALSAKGSLSFTVTEEPFLPLPYRSWGESKHDVPLQKEWLIRTNRPIHENSATIRNLFITAAHLPYRKIPTQIRLSADRQEVYLSSSEPLRPSTIYTLWIRSLQSSEGHSLKQPLRLDFETISVP